MNLPVPHTQSIPLSLDFLPQPAIAAYLESGTGRPVLLLHGFLGEAANWRPLMTQLATDYHCLGLDLLGFGASAKPAIRYDIAREVAFVHAFIQQLALPPCVLIGHSFGGWVAAAYALAHPEQVQGLGLVAPAGIRDDSFCGRYDHLRFLLWETPLVDAGLWLAQQSLRWGPPQAAVTQLREFRQALMANPAARAFLGDRLQPEAAIDTVEQDIHRLPHPTLVIAAEHDETIPRWHCETYAQVMPAAQLVVIPNASHALPQEQPTALADHLRPFLATTAPHQP